jgi:hypothetical protein
MEFREPVRQPAGTRPRHPARQPGPPGLASRAHGTAVAEHHRWWDRGRRGRYQNPWVGRHERHGRWPSETRRLPVGRRAGRIGRWATAARAAGDGASPAGTRMACTRTRTRAGTPRTRGCGWRTPVERQRRQIVRVRQLDQRPREAQLDDVPVQRHALDAAEAIGEVLGRRADSARHLVQSDRVGELRLEELLHPADQASRRPGRSGDPEACPWPSARPARRGSSRPASPSATTRRGS